MNIVKPKSLKSGDKIAIIAPAGNIDKVNLYNGVKKLKEFGFDVTFSDSIFEKNRYLADTDENKIKEIENYFADKSISGILCARGGYGSIRLINKINYEIIQNNPKFFGGYSDITALQLMFLKNAGLVTYTSPMVCSDFGSDISQFTQDSFVNTVIKDEKIALKGEVIVSGESEGILWGGNLSTIVSLCGLDFLPDRDFIFFAEDLNEPVYKIDRMFRQLMNIPQFRKHVKGVVFGEFSKVEKNAWLDVLKAEILFELNVPSLEILDITHSKDKLTLPIGEIFKIKDENLIQKNT